MHGIVVHMAGLYAIPPPHFSPHIFTYCKGCAHENVNDVMISLECYSQGMRLLQLLL